jgi:drug/metabolite transporter (DMT)-like permease
LIGAAAGLALGAAFCYAFAATLQHRAARQEATTRTLDPRLLVRMVRRPLWLAGGLADIAGVSLHGTALALGPLALVQPLLVSGLILAVPLEAAFDRRRPSRRDLLAVTVSALGLGTFVILADPRPGPIAPDDAPLLGAVIAVGALMVVLVGIASLAPKRVRATVLGVAAGAGYALAAALAKAVADRVGRDGLGVFADWHLYALAVVGLVAVVLNQNAFQAGTLAGPLTGIELTDPLVSLVIAASVYQEQIAHDSVNLVGEALGIGAMAVGVWLVSSRPSATR